MKRNTNCVSVSEELASLTTHELSTMLSTIATFGMGDFNAVRVRLSIHPTSVTSLASLFSSLGPSESPLREPERLLNMRSKDVL